MQGYVDERQKTRRLLARNKVLKASHCGGACAARINGGRDATAQTVFIRIHTKGRAVLVAMDVQVNWASSEM